MPRKRNAAASVLNYFATASVESAVLVLGLAKDVVKSRQPKPVATAGKTRARKAKRPTGVPLPGVQSAVGG